MPFPLLLIGAFAAGSKAGKLSTTRRVAFTAKKKVPKTVKVGFKTKAGKPVAFSARKSVTEKVPVKFRARNAKKKKK
jgi:hypothetical protein